ncbi:MAG: hypothetical protein WB784_06550 [Rhodanobacteraceae bacterium]
MSDRDSTLNLHPDVALAAALRALPDTAPQPDLWPDLARSLERRTQHKARRRLVALPAALAAAIVLAVLIARAPSPRQQTPATTTASATSVVSPTANAPTTVAAANGAHELADLRRRSQSLERWIAGFAHAPQDGRDLMAAVEVEDLIGLVDLQLGATRGDDDALPLWRQRVALLEDLATIRGSAYAIAASDDGSTPASLNHLN